ncbi:rRNA maturation RNase YbeY [Phaeovulum vinaykumarii]|uniref:Endoribonuclease YbeY n=1 Tax=Phaeovulum vinaykumarii TaxID=407234 RepID=A0A1N7M248_9RHOB|nr:rRNA maturation RNase YbeY [Phaeovulum vinaykumarii]SOC09354.1 rRNA maturation RNase YbeY [Phaeovulum vinaykumarii]
MEPLVDTLIEEPRWDGIDLETLADRAARAVLAALDLPGTGFTLACLACGDARIAALNAEFRGKNTPTNVLSWPSEERGAEVAGGRPDLPAPGSAIMPAELGDIAIAWETCVREAAEQGKRLQDHVTHLLVHAMLHLLGYDHLEEADAEVMEALETRILAGLGIADPYADPAAAAEFRAADPLAPEGGAAGAPAGAARPDVSGPDVSGPDVAGSDVSGPDTAPDPAPDGAAPGTVLSRAGLSGLSEDA